MAYIVSFYDFSTHLHGFTHSFVKMEQYYGSQLASTICHTVSYMPVTS